MGSAFTKKEAEPDFPVEPSGLYKNVNNWDLKYVRKLVINKKLAPLYSGKEEGTFGDADLEECPICFLVSRSHKNVDALTSIRIVLSRWAQPFHLLQERSMHRYGLVVTSLMLILSVSAECYLQIKKPHGPVVYPYLVRAPTSIL
jgi:hypothetical protein